MRRAALFLTLASTVQKATSALTLAETDKCTTIIVGKNAGTEGPMTTHTADCSDCDFRVSKVTFDHVSFTLAQPM